MRPAENPSLQPVLETLIENIHRDARLVLLMTGGIDNIYEYDSLGIKEKVNAVLEVKKAAI